MTSERQQVLNEVHRRVGRNVLLFQLIEQRLKVLLPFIHYKGARHCLDGIEDRFAQSARRTLGQLLGSFNEVVTTNGDVFSRFLAELSNLRNDLVHQFHSSPNVDLSTIDGCRRTAEYLDLQFEHARQFNILVQGIQVDILEALRDFTFKDTSEHENFAKLCEQARQGLN